MPDRGNLEDVSLEELEHMLNKLLGNTSMLGFGYVYQLVYELFTIYLSKQQGFTKVLHNSLSSYLNSEDMRFLIQSRNLLNHNSYKKDQVILTINKVLKSEVVKKLYVSVFGSANNYSIFETQAYVYLDNMKMLWLVK